MEIGAGAAIPVVVVTDDKVQGITARPVYGYQVASTDRPVMGGKAKRVKVITTADLQENGGIYKLSGEPYAMRVYTDPSGETDGGFADAVYPINVWPYMDYLIYDAFSNALGAGSVNGTVATIPPNVRINGTTAQNTRNAVDGGNKISVANGKLTVAAGDGTWGNTNLYYGSHTRARWRHGHR